MNKVQIENEGYLKKTNALNFKLEGKDRLIRHLENKVTQVMVEKEESSVTLKSEIVLLQNKLDEGQDTMTRKTNKMRSLLTNEAKDEV